MSESSSSSSRCWSSGVSGEGWAVSGGLAEALVLAFCWCPAKHKIQYSVGDLFLVLITVNEMSGINDLINMDVTD